MKDMFSDIAFPSGKSPPSFPRLPVVTSLINIRVGFVARISIRFQIQIADMLDGAEGLPSFLPHVTTLRSFPQSRTGFKGRQQRR